MEKYDFDVAIVGARCAGSPLAARLARGGLRVVVVDKDTFPSDAKSTHMFQPVTVAAFDRLGVLDRLLATGAPLVNDVRMRIEDVDLIGKPTLREGERGFMSIRRSVLDAILVDVAREAGADVRTGTKVTGLLETNGRVSGIKLGDEELRAKIVIGADGYRSLVAKAVGAREYAVTDGDRGAYWGYYRGVKEDVPRVHLARWGEEVLIAAPTDSGLYEIIIPVDADQMHVFAKDPERCFDDVVSQYEPVAALVAGTSRIEPLHRMGVLRGFFRESVGPGWVLFGDAGHCKDPTPGQGIGDALLQGERLAAIIFAHLDDPRSLDAALGEWWRWRDESSFDMYWFGQDLGRAGQMVAPVLEVFRGLDESAKQDFIDVFNRTKKPSDVLTPPRLLAATARLLFRGDDPRGEVLRATWAIVREQVQRKKLSRPCAVGLPAASRAFAARPARERTARAMSLL